MLIGQMLTYFALAAAPDLHVCYKLVVPLRDFVPRVTSLVPVPYQTKVYCAVYREFLC